MSSIVGQLPGPAKGGNSSNPPVASPQSASVAVDSGSQRRPGGSGSFGAGATSRSAPSARNNQPRKNQHRRQRRPGLGQEDVPEESVSGPPSRIARSMGRRKGEVWALIILGGMCLGRHEVDNKPQGSDVHHPPDEILSASPSAALSQSVAPRRWAAECLLGFRLSRRG
jgi:hypothetical protein